MLFKKILKIVFWLVSFSALFLFILFINLHHIVESQIKKSDFLLHFSGRIAFDMQQFGLSSAHISSIRLSDSISVDSANIDHGIHFKPGNIIKPGFNIKRVTLSGVNIHAFLDKDGKIEIKGLNLPGTSEKSSKNNIKSFMPFWPRKIIVKNSKLMLHTEEEDFIIPFDALSSFYAPGDTINTAVRFYPFGEIVNTIVNYRAGEGIKYVKIEGKSLNTGYLNEWIAKKSDQFQFGRFTDFKLESFSPAEKWKVYISNIVFSKPSKMELKDIKTDLSFTGLKWNVNGFMKLAASPLSSELDLQYGMTLRLNKKEKKIKSEFTLKTGLLNMHSSDMNMSFPAVNISGEFSSGKNLKPSCSLVVNAKKGRLKALQYKLRARGIDIHMPLFYPAPGKKKYGTYSISSIYHDNRFAFHARGSVLQKKLSEFFIKGNMGFNLIPDIKTRFDARVKAGSNPVMSCEFETDSFKISESDIQKISLRKMPETRFDITASLKGKMTYHDHKLRSSMTLNLAHGTLQMDEDDLVVKGINSDIYFNNLFLPETSPGQIMVIDSIKKNKIKIDDTEIRFTIGQGKYLLVENIKFKWCKGLVSTEAIRFPEESGQYALSLYCDRLELTQLLKQMDAFDARGFGSLSGRIPVVYSNGSIKFDNGFLFSTPGKGGKIIIKNSERITSGIPMDTPQFSQLDLAGEALKDFNYKWVKLKLNTVEDTLLVNMELDGKPSKIMPFEYSKKKGGFIRVDASSAGSHFQGIKLDINLKLPFNEVLRSGSKLQSILN